MSKLEKSRTLSLGRLATLSTIRGNLNVKTSFQKSDHQFSSAQHGASSPKNSRSQTSAAHGCPESIDNFTSNRDEAFDDVDTPPLVFSAISKYSLQRARSCRSDDIHHECDDNLDLADFTSSSKDRRNSNKTTATKHSASVGESRSNADHLFAPPDLRVGTASSDVSQLLQQPSASIREKASANVTSSNFFDEDSERPLFQSKLQRLYNSSSNRIDDRHHQATWTSRSTGTAQPAASQSLAENGIVGKGVRARKAYDIGDAEIEKFHVQRGPCQEDEIISSLSSRSSSGATTVLGLGDDLEDQSQIYNPGRCDDDEEFDEEYWSVPAKLPDLAIDERDLNTGDEWIPRHPDLVRVKGHHHHPFAAEAPLSTLVHFGFLTPTALHFVHNHGPVPRAAWDKWSLEVTGLVKTSKKKFTMRDLLLLPSRRVPVTLMCAGNRRKELRAASRASAVVEGGGGLEWGAGAVSTSVWGGARLRDVLLQCGAVGMSQEQVPPKVTGRERGRNRHHPLFVRLLGADNYGTSIPLEVAMDESRDVLLAYEQNMDLLAPDHGFPLRLIVPGCTAGRSVKWIQKIEVSQLCSDNYFHAHENRMLPSHIKDLRLALSEGWLERPEFEVGDTNVNSVISSPAHNTNILSVGPTNPMTHYSITGFAYSGGGKRISRVELSLDGGRTWDLCLVNYPERPNKGGKFWCWCFWKLKVKVRDLSHSSEIVVRAWDSAMNTQPENLVWNIFGVMNNCWYRVKIVHELTIEGDEPPTMTFQHPTQPGKTVGGWMTKIVQPETDMERVLSGNLLHEESSPPCRLLDTERTPRPWRI